MNMSKKLMGLLLAGVVFTSLPYAYSAESGAGSAGAAAAAGGSASEAFSSDEEYDLYYYAMNGDIRGVERLLAEGADVNEADGDGWTALMVACRADRDSDDNSSNYQLVVRALIDAGANVNKADLVGKTPLMYAREYGHEDLVEILEKAGGRGYEVGAGVASGGGAAAGGASSS